MKVNILAINDFHSKHDPEKITINNEIHSVGGSLRLAQCIVEERRKAEAEGAKLLSFVVGDMFLGSDYFAYFDGEVEMKLLNLLKFDAFAVGNHDFDQGGVPNLLEQAKNAPGMPLLCANVYDESKNLLFEPYKIFEENGIRIGVVALMGPDAWTAIAHSLKEGLEIEDMIECARNLRKKLDEQGITADYWIALSHSGINRGDLELAQTGLFDAVFSGHEHFMDLQQWQDVKTPNGVCHLHAGNCNGRAVSKLEIEICPEGKKKVELTTLELNDKRANTTGPIVTQVSAMLESYQHKIEELAGEVIAHCHSTEYSKDFLGYNFCPHTPVPLSNIVLDAFFHGCFQSPRVKELQLPKDRVFAAFNFGSLRGALPKGDVSIKHVCTALPFNELIEVVKLEGDIVDKMMKRNLERASRRKPNKPPGMGYHFKWLSGQAPDIVHHEVFYMVTSQYLRQNDIHELLSNSSEEKTVPHKVVWTMEENELGSINGIRDALVDLIRCRAVLH